MRGRVKRRGGQAHPRTASSHRDRRAGTRVGLVLTLALGVGLLGGVGSWMMLGSGAGTTAAGEPVERFMHVHGLGIAPWAPDEVYVSTHQGLIRIDGGGAWHFVSEEPHDLMGFAIDPTEPEVLYSSGHPAPGSGLSNPIGFMVSTDAGATWTPRALEGEVDFHAVAVEPTDGQVVYGWDVAGGGLLRSTDSGHGWETLSGDLLERAGGVSSLAVDPSDPERVLAGTPAALLETTDGGASWTALLELPVSAVVTVAADPARVLAYAATPDEGLLESQDGGATWTSVGLVVHDDAVGHLAVHPTDPGTIYAGTFGEDLYRTVDGGRTWEQLAEAGEPAVP